MYYLDTLTSVSIFKKIKRNMHELLGICAGDCVRRC